MKIEFLILTFIEMNIISWKIYMIRDWVKTCYSEQKMLSKKFEFQDYVFFLRLLIINVSQEI